jgi:hypothetical protein
MTKKKDRDYNFFMVTAIFFLGVRATRGRWQKTPCYTHTLGVPTANLSESLFL